jgi:MOSC domain-containing protein YiiM
VLLYHDSFYAPYIIAHHTMTSDSATNSTIHQLTQHFSQHGRLEAIFVRPQREAPCVFLTSTHAIVGKGLLGDRSCNTNSRHILGNGRQVTLIQAEHLAVISALLRKTVHPSELRRNLVVSGLNILATKPLLQHQPAQLTIGDVVLEITGPCAPCSKMERILGHGGYNAMRGHGGVTARVIKGGILHLGDAVGFNQTTLPTNPQISLF